MIKTRILPFITAILLLASCTPQLYYWGSYEIDVNTYNKKRSPEAEQILINTYEKIIAKKQKGSIGKVPPGVYADYGFILINKGEIERGTELLKLEMEAYPESALIIQTTLDMVKNE